MCKEHRFFRCKLCGKIIGIINDPGTPTICCGQQMEELVANTVEASQEKHLPVVTIKGDTVEVAIGSVAHPMTEEHHIAWVYLETNHGGQRKCLGAGVEPKVQFKLTADDKVIAAYEYCNLHGLWKTEV
ncbi:MAG TPA: desulfoferrodoxin family protein [Clostridia bacterium]|nr:desulfoferrodoxin family protein [Clostridia bacterium]